jgi:hypothetical protein
MDLSYHARHSMSPLSEDLTSAVPTRYRKPPGAAAENPVMSQVGLQGWVIVDVPQYPRYKTSTVAPEPFIKRVAEVVRLMEGRIDAHMLQWVPSQDRIPTMGHRGMTVIMTCDQSQHP